MSERTATDGVRERDERDARFFAWDVPGDAHIVALVHEAGDSERSATVADAIATSVARRREHTLLLSAEPGPSPLDELLGAAHSQGLPAALEGRVRLTDVAVQRVDRPFVYLPAGSDPEAMKSLLEDEVLASFVDRVRERGGTLFIVLSEETLRLDGLRALIDGYVALGDATVPELALELAQFGRVRYENGEQPAENGDQPAGNGAKPKAIEGLPDLPPLPEPDLIPLAGDSIAETATPGEGVEVVGDEVAAEDEEEASAAAAATLVEGSAPAIADVAEAHPILDAGEESRETEPPQAVPAGAAAPAGTAGPDVADEPETGEASAEAWQRHRKPVGLPAKQIAIGLTAIVGVAAVWWLLARGAGDGPADGTVAGDAIASTAVGPPSAPPTTGGLDALPFDGAAAAAAFDAAPPLGYSVMIASFAVQADADERLRQLRASGPGFYFVSPTPVRGVVYHRVFAGALGTRDEAQELMDELVASGIKDEAGAWHLRPAALAFDLGSFPDRQAADVRIDDLAARSIPAYALMASNGSDTVWRVYGGAYVDERESGPMREMLTAAGEPAELIARHGALP